MSEQTKQQLRDATFAEGAEQPLALMAADTDDLAVIAALLQDAVFPASEMKYLPRERRFALLLNRFRWEDFEAARRQNRPFERVQTLFVADDVMKVASQGVRPGDPDLVLSLLDITFEPAEDGAGSLILTLAGDGAIRLDVEAINVMLKDVTRPYIAPSRKAPQHPE